MHTSVQLDSSVHSKAFLTELYRSLVYPRLIEEKMLLLLRQGRISKWFAGIGQEAISVGATSALKEDEYIFTLHRNLGVFTTRNVPLTRLIAQFQGKQEGFTNGRDRSFHFGAPDYGIIGMISHLGPQLAVAGGMGLAHRLREEQKVALAFTGEGGTSEGDFHEAMNVAAVWDLPVIFIIENNGYALSTPTNEQYRCKKLSSRAKGYGMEGVTINGNDVMEVYETVRYYAESLRKDPRPVMIECTTFRMRGHEEASGVKYVPPKLLSRWAKKDPIEHFEEYLEVGGILKEKKRESIREDLKASIDEAVEEAFAYDDVQSDEATEIASVYPEYHIPTTDISSRKTETRRFVDAISDGLSEAMEADDALVIMGQDVGSYGGVFKITEGFTDRFGDDRVRNTPLCESAILGVALGLSLKGIPSVVEMQFADFVSSGYTQIVNNLAKVHYRWGQEARVVVRMPAGGGVGAGPFHSQTNEAWFFSTPGLRIYYPSNPVDAKGLLLNAIEYPGPVMFFEHKKLYRSISDEVPEGYYTIEAGKARVVSDGTDCTIVTYGLGVYWAMALQEAHPDYSIEILDLRTLQPYDFEAIQRSVAKTSRALVVYEATMSGAVGSELSARISEELFEHLDAPVHRCAGLDTPVPFAKNLEANFHGEKRLEETFLSLMNY